MGFPHCDFVLVGFGHMRRDIIMSLDPIMYFNNSTQDKGRDRMDLE